MYMKDPGSVIDAVPLPDGTYSLGQLLVHAGRSWPDREALVFPDLRCTYRDLLARSWEVARVLLARGVEFGDRVGLLMSNSVELVASIYGASLAGAIPVPINVRYTPLEIRSLLLDAEVNAILTFGTADDYKDLGGNLLEAVPEIATGDLRGVPGMESVRLVAHLGAREDLPGVASWDDALDDAHAVADQQVVQRCVGTRLRDVGLILYTSGTTSLPRGALLTNEAFVRTWTAVGNAWGITGSDRFWDPLPMFHLAALGPMTFIFGRGATMLTDTYFDAGRGLRQIEEERATWIYPAYPPIMQALAAEPDFAARDLSSIRAYMTVGPPETLERYEDYIPHAPQISLYGLTEGGALAFTRLTDPRTARTHTCGHPLPGVSVRIMDPETGQECPVGVPGEIQFRGFNAFSGYYNDPDKTASTLLDGGWVATGDRGMIDGDDRIAFQGRIKEMLKVGGENVAPAEIEARLSEHPAVKLCQAVGMPDERLDEVPVVFVELMPGQDATEEELIEFCRKGLASFKVPRLVRFVQAWPMSTTKIQRSVLRQQLLEELGSDLGGGA
jgi:fatty-acyl-CoA synthase